MQYGAESAAGEGGEGLFCPHCSVIAAMVLPQEAFLLRVSLSTQWSTKKVALQFDNYKGIWVYFQ